MTTTLDLSGPRERLGWAKHHYDILYSEVVRALAGNGDPDAAFRMTQHFDSQTSCEVWTCTGVPDLPEHTGLMVGDVLHAMRSALDHLAWIMVKTGSDPSPQYPRKVEFPICDSSGEYKGRLQKALPGVRGDQRAEVRAVQPYKGGEVPDALRFLRDYNNLDKHRLTHTQLVGISEGHLEYKATDCEVGSPIPPLDGPPILKVGAEALRIFVRPTGPDHKLEMEPNCTVRPYVAFEDKTGVFQHLANAYEGVSTILATMARVWP